MNLNSSKKMILLGTYQGTVYNYSHIFTSRISPIIKLKTSA